MMGISPIDGRCKAAARVGTERGSMMAKAAHAEVRILDLDEAKAIINCLRMMTGYARALEQVVHNTYEGELAIQDVTPDEAIQITRDVHGIQPIDLEF